MLLEDLERLAQINKDLLAERKQYRRNTKPMRDEKRLLEASIIDEVLKAGKTVQTADIKAEFVPTVVISMVKEQSND